MTQYALIRIVLVAMRLITHYNDPYFSEHPHDSIVTIGNFDGLHMGHRHVIAAGSQLAREQGMRHIVLTFEPHPAEYLHPNSTSQRKSQRLCTYTQKYALLEAMAPDVLLAQQFDNKFAHMSAAHFVSEVLCNRLRAKAIAVGENFKFGARREGDIHLLRTLGSDRTTTCQFELLPHQLVKKDGMTVSSSFIRDCIKKGDISTANALLERPYALGGNVTHGEKKGRGFGYPTVNLAHTEVLIPASGIYAARCHIDANTVYDAAVYIGQRPTTRTGFAIEAHLLNFDGDLYHRDVTLHFMARVRAEQTFETEAAMIAQIKRDIESVKHILELP